MVLEAVRREPATGKAEQLVVLLHGVGADGHDLIDLAVPWTKGLPQATFLAPHAPDPYDSAPFGRQWFSVLDRTPERAARRRTAGGRAVAGDSGRRARTARPRAGGGGIRGVQPGRDDGAARRAGKAPGAESGACVFWGVDSPERVETATPVLLVHGEADEVVPWRRSLDAERALRLLSVPVETLWEPRLGHAIDDAGLALGGLFLQRAFSGASVTRA